MQENVGGERRIFHAKVDASGRIVIPADSELRKHVRRGDKVVVEEDAHGLHVKTMEQVVREAQEYFLSVIPSGVSLVDELIDERREEAAREARE